MTSNNKKRLKNPSKTALTVLPTFPGLADVRLHGSMLPHPSNSDELLIFSLGELYGFDTKKEVFTLLSKKFNQEPSNRILHSKILIGLKPDTIIVIAHKPSIQSLFYGVFDLDQNKLVFHRFLKKNKPVAVNSNLHVSNQKLYQHMSQWSGSGDVLIIKKKWLIISGGLSLIFLQNCLLN